ALKRACEQGSSLHRTWAYLDGKCVAGKARKPRTVRVETDRPAIAAIAIGRVAAPERADEPVSSAASAPTGPQAAPLQSTRAAHLPPGGARRGGGRGGAAPAAGRSVQEAAENSTQPPAPPRAGGNRCRLVARGAHRRRRGTGLWRARLWPWRGGAAGGPRVPATRGRFFAG